MEPLHRAKGTAKILNCSEPNVYALAKSGALRAGDDV